MTTPTKAAPQIKPANTAAVRPLSAARSMLLQKKCACGAGSSSGECEACHRREREQHERDDKKKQGVQRSAAGRAPAASTAPPAVSRVLNSPGRPLDASTRSFMEPRFGRDFTSVRVHTGPQAAESARAVNAHAYTVGQNIVFDHGKFDPATQPGRHLLAHELAHTVQQQGLQRSANDISLGESTEYHHLEHEAESAALSVMSGQPGPALAMRPSRSIVSRAAKDNDDEKKPTATSKSPGKAADGQSWEDVKPGSALDQAGVKQQAGRQPGVSQDIQAFNVGDLDLPPEKGNVLSVWKGVAASGALQAIVEQDGGSRSKLGLKQERPNTDKLRDIWLQKVKWKPEDAETNWKKAATTKDAF